MAMPSKSDVTSNAESARRIRGEIEVPHLDALNAAQAERLVFGHHGDAQRRHHGEILVERASRFLRCEGGAARGDVILQRPLTRPATHRQPGKQNGPPFRGGAPIRAPRSRSLMA